MASPRGLSNTSKHAAMATDALFREVFGTSLSPTLSPSSTSNSNRNIASSSNVNNSIQNSNANTAGARGGHSSNLTTRNTTAPKPPLSMATGSPRRQRDVVTTMMAGTQSSPSDSNQHQPIDQRKRRSNFVGAMNMWGGADDDTATPTTASGSAVSSRSVTPTAPPVGSLQSGNPKRRVVIEASPNGLVSRHPNRVSDINTTTTRDNQRSVLTTDVLKRGGVDGPRLTFGDATHYQHEFLVKSGAHNSDGGDGEQDVEDGEEGAGNRFFSKFADFSSDDDYLSSTYGSSRQSPNSQSLLLRSAQPANGDEGNKDTHHPLANGGGGRGGDNERNTPRTRRRRHRKLTEQEKHAKRSAVMQNILFALTYDFPQSRIFDDYNLDGTLRADGKKAQRRRERRMLRDNNNSKYLYDGDDDGGGSDAAVVVVDDIVDRILLVASSHDAHADDRDGNAGKRGEKEEDPLLFTRTQNDMAAELAQLEEQRLAAAAKSRRHNQLGIRASPIHAKHIGAIHEPEEGGVINADTHHRVDFAQTVPALRKHHFEDSEQRALKRRQHNTQLDTEATTRLFSETVRDTRQVRHALDERDVVPSKAPGVVKLNDFVSKFEAFGQFDKESAMRRVSLEQKKLFPEVFAGRLAAEAEKKRKQNQGNTTNAPQPDSNREEEEEDRLLALFDDVEGARAHMGFEAMVAEDRLANPHHATNTATEEAFGLYRRLADEEAFDNWLQVGTSESIADRVARLESEMMVGLVDDDGDCAEEASNGLNADRTRRPQFEAGGGNALSIADVDDCGAVGDDATMSSLTTAATSLPSPFMLTSAHSSKIARIMLGAPQCTREEVVRYMHGAFNFGLLQNPTDKGTNTASSEDSPQSQRSESSADSTSRDDSDDDEDMTTRGLSAPNFDTLLRQFREWRVSIDSNATVESVRTAIENAQQKQLASEKKKAAGSPRRRGSSSTEESDGDEGPNFLNATSPGGGAVIATLPPHLESSPVGATTAVGGSTGDPTPSSSSYRKLSDTVAIAQLLIADAVSRLDVFTAPLSFAAFEEDCERCLAALDADSSRQGAGGGISSSNTDAMTSEALLMERLFSSADGSILPGNKIHAGLSDLYPEMGGCGDGGSAPAAGGMKSVKIIVGSAADGNTSSSSPTRATSSDDTTTFVVRSVQQPDDAVTKAAKEAKAVVYVKGPVRMRVPYVDSSRALDKAHDAVVAIAMQLEEEFGGDDYFDGDDAGVEDPQKKKGAIAATAAPLSGFDSIPLSSPSHNRPSQSNSVVSAAAPSTDETSSPFGRHPMRSSFVAFASSSGAFDGADANEGSRSHRSGGTTTNAGRSRKVVGIVEDPSSMSLSPQQPDLSSGSFGTNSPTNTTNTRSILRQSFAMVGRGRKSVLTLIPKITSLSCEESPNTMSGDFAQSTSFSQRVAKRLSISASAGVFPSNGAGSGANRRSLALAAAAGGGMPPIHQLKGTFFRALSYLRNPDEDPSSAAAGLIGAGAGYGNGSLVVAGGGGAPVFSNPAESYLALMKRGQYDDDSDDDKDDDHRRGVKISTSKAAAKSAADHQSARTISRRVNDSAAHVMHLEEAAAGKNMSAEDLIAAYIDTLVDNDKTVAEQQLGGDALMRTLLKDYTYLSAVDVSDMILQLNSMGAMRKEEQPIKKKAASDGATTARLPPAPRRKSLFLPPTLPADIAKSANDPLSRNADDEDDDASSNTASTRDPSTATAVPPIGGSAPTIANTTTFNQSFKAFASATEDSIVLKALADEAKNLNVSAANRKWLTAQGSEHFIFPRASGKEDVVKRRERKRSGPRGSDGGGADHLDIDDESDLDDSDDDEPFANNTSFATSTGLAHHTTPAVSKITGSVLRLAFDLDYIEPVAGGGWLTSIDAIMRHVKYQQLPTAHAILEPCSAVSTFASKLWVFLSCQVAIDEEDAVLREAVGATIVNLQERLSKFSNAVLALETKVSEFEAMRNMEQRVTALINRELVPLEFVIASLLKNVPFPEQREALKRCASDINGRAAKVVDILHELGSTAPAMLQSNDRWLKTTINDCYARLEAVSEGWASLACGFIDPALGKLIIDTDANAAGNKGNECLRAIVHNNSALLMMHQAALMPQQKQQQQHDRSGDGGAAESPLPATTGGGSSIGGGGRQHPAAATIRQYLFELSEDNVRQLEDLILKHRIGGGGDDEGDIGNMLSPPTKNITTEELAATAKRNTFSPAATSAVAHHQQQQELRQRVEKGLGLSVVTLPFIIRRLACEYRHAPAIVALKVKGVASESVGLQLCMASRYVLGEAAGKQFDAAWGFSMGYCRPPAK